MAHKKGVGSTDNGRDSSSNRLGIKLFGGEAATAGNILVRQRGTKYHPGVNVYLSKDFSIHAKVDGTVRFSKGKKDRTVINIVPTGTTAPVAKAAKPAAKATKPAAKAAAKKAPAAAKKAPAKKAAKQEEE